MGTQLAPLPERGTAAPHFLAHVYRGQMAGWIKMPRGMEVGHIVLVGDPAAHSPKRGTVAQFSACV